MFNLKKILVFVLFVSSFFMIPGGMSAQEGGCSVDCGEITISCNEEETEECEEGEEYVLCDDVRYYCPS